MACFLTNIFNTGFLYLCFLCSLFAIVCLFVFQREREVWSWMSGKVGGSGRSWGKGKRDCEKRNHNQNTLYEKNNCQ